MSATSRCFRAVGAATRAALAVMMLSGLIPEAAWAQDPNPGAITLTAAFDVPSLYMFRGIRQEIDPAVTMWPYADVGILFFSDGTGAVKSFGVNAGVWNSLHTGSSGTGDGGPDRLHYELDFYSSFTLGLGGNTSFMTQYTAYTSPSRVFTNVKEVLFKVSHASTYAPYGLVAFEVGGEDSGQADGGFEKGTYLEFGIGPSWPLGGDRTLAVPVKIGLSADDYYELAGDDKKFGYFDIGALVTLPISQIPSRFGSWNFHLGGNYMALGEMTEAFNVDNDGDTSKHQLIGLFGFGVSY